MIPYILTFKLTDAKTSDPERLFVELTRALTTKLRLLKRASGCDPALGVVYLYTGRGSLSEITAASYQAAQHLGREYSFTINCQHGRIGDRPVEKRRIA